jgi:hypothetical protein
MAAEPAAQVVRYSFAGEAYRLASELPTLV